jgi:hypothetical protein
MRLGSAFELAAGLHVPGARAEERGVGSCAAHRPLAVAGGRPRYDFAAGLVDPMSSRNLDVIV